MRLPRVLLLWILLVIILGVLGIHIGILGTGIHKIEAQLKNKVEQKLAENNIDWAEVKIKGQTVDLEGTAPDRAAIHQAREVALTAAGTGGILRGGITKVYSDKVHIAEEPAIIVEESVPVSSPDYDPVFEATLDTNKFSVKGDISNPYSENALRVWTEEYFPQQSLSYDFNAVESPIDSSWYEAIRNGIKGLSYLSSGYLKARGSTISVEGLARSEKERNLALESLSRIKSPYSLGVQITVDKIADEALEKARDTCQEHLNTLKGDTKIHFLFGSTKISKEDDVLLKKVAEAIQQCKGLRVRIEGHTDNIGSMDINNSLSFSRAEAVVIKLIDFGVDKEKLLAVGHGSKQPIAENATKEGRTKNRRIEFVIEK